jgi:hypothetical protein
VGGLEVLTKGARVNLSFIGVDSGTLEVLGMFCDELEKSSISVRADISMKSCRNWGEFAASPALSRMPSTDIPSGI